MMLLQVGNVLVHLRAGDAAIFPRPYRSYHAMNRENSQYIRIVTHFILYSTITPWLILTKFNIWDL